MGHGASPQRRKDAEISAEKKRAKSKPENAGEEKARRHHEESTTWVKLPERRKDAEENAEKRTAKFKT